MRAGRWRGFALSVFDSFFRAASAGRFPDLDNRDDLWRCW